VDDRKNESGAGMKLLRDSLGPPEGALMEALVVCVAHRCLPHREIPPLNYSEGNGSSECGVCAAEEFGQRLAEQALVIQERDVLFPVLDGYADRLEYGARMRAVLTKARDRLNFSAPGAGYFIEEFLRDGA
jgi:hypothetical protein